MNTTLDDPFEGKTEEEVLATNLCGCSSCRRVLDKAYKIAFELFQETRATEEEEKKTGNKNCLISNLAVAMLIEQYFANMVGLAIHIDEEDGKEMAAMKTQALIHGMHETVSQLMLSAREHIEGQIKDTLSSGDPKMMN